MRGALGCGSSEAGTDLPTGCRPFDSFRHRTTPNRTQKIHLTNPPTAAVSFARTRAAPKPPSTRETAMLPGILAKQTGPGLSSSLLAKAYGRITAASDEPNG